MPVRDKTIAVLRRGWLAGLAARELGFSQVAWYGLYRLGVGSGHYRRVLAAPLPGEAACALHPVLEMPAPDSLSMVMSEPDRAALLAEADEIVAGQVRLFGGAPQSLVLVPPGPLQYWTAYEHGIYGDAPHGDIKFPWEPARFGWALCLGRAYRLSGDERYPAAFWWHTQTFEQANPPYLGPHWASAQEVALRLMALVFAAQAFAASPQSTASRLARLSQAIARHAARILPTLPYARAQNNNHLLSEAAGLYTAGLALPDHPQAATWRETGWKVFHQGLWSQITLDGTYSQHSTNYHRLMLQLALWVDALSRAEGRPWPVESLARLSAATAWLFALLDPASGQVPNLGPNAVAYIFPFTSLPFADYRPVLQAAASRFRGRPPLAAGPWDEMGLWFGGPSDDGLASQDGPPTRASGARPRLAGQPAGQGEPPQPWQDQLHSLRPHTLRSPDEQSWAYLRVAHFDGRPGHADQLHLDLWWRGINVAQDAGTYLYNAAPPWDNALRQAEVHNTVTVFGQDQMQPAGRFLYIRRAQARLVSYRPSAVDQGAALTASHTGYARLGLLCTRTVEVTPTSRWCIEDAITAGHPGRVPQGEALSTLHWLLPDWPWQVQAAGDGRRFVLLLAALGGEVCLELSSSLTPGLQIARAGQLVYGVGAVKPTWGWSSPTYGDKIPALSIRLTVSGPLPIRFTTSWVFPETE